MARLDVGISHRGEGERPVSLIARLWNDHLEWFFLAVPLVFFSLFFAYPLIHLVAGSLPGLSIKAYRSALHNAFFVRSVERTLLVSAIVTGATLLLGYPIAHYLTRRASLGRQVLLGLLLLTFWISALVRTYSWIPVLQPGGILGKLLAHLGFGAQTSFLYTETGVTIGMIHVLLPYMVLALMPSLHSVDPRLVEAARSLGAGRLRALMRVVLPLTRGGVAAGVILVFILAVGFYITPALLGSPGNVFVSQVIGQQIGQFQAFGVAAAMSILFTAPVVGVYFLASTLFPRESVFGAMEL